MVSVVKAFVICQIHFLLFDRAEDSLGVRVLCALSHSGHADMDRGINEGSLALVTSMVKSVNG